MSPPVEPKPLRRIREFYAGTLSRQDAEEWLREVKASSCYYCDEGYEDEDCSCLDLLAKQETLESYLSESYV